MLRRLILGALLTAACPGLVACTDSEPEPARATPGLERPQGLPADRSSEQSIELGSDLAQTPDEAGSWRAEALQARMQPIAQAALDALFSREATPGSADVLAADIDHSLPAVPGPDPSSLRLAVVRASDDQRKDGQGAQELLNAIGSWRAAWFPGGVQRPHLKIVRVEEVDGSPRATALLDVHSAPGAALRSLLCLLELRWNAELTQLVGFDVHELHLVQAPSEEALLEDIGAAALGSSTAWDEDLTRSLEEWCGRLDRGLGTSLIGHEGLAVGDADGDGHDDLYLCAPGGLPNRLFLSGAGARGADSAARAGLDLLDATRSALFLDLDNDGDQDLALNADPKLLLYENDGLGVFRERLRMDAPSTASMSAADHDLDGDLDLFLCGYVLPDVGHATPLPYHDARNGRPNRLMRNEIEGQDWRFDDATAECGLDQGNGRFSLAAAWEDYDDDGDPDLYVANDFGRNNLYRNDGGRFVDVAAQAGVEDMAAGMGVSWGDPDRDGDMDLYVSNMYSAAGGRVTYDRAFQPQASPELLSAYRRHARGNSLFENQGDGTFVDVSAASGAQRAQWAWGGLFHDLDGDGWEDLVVPNGFVTGDDADDL